MTDSTWIKYKNLVQVYLQAYPDKMRLHGNYLTDEEKLLLAAYEAALETHEQIGS